MTGERRLISKIKDWTGSTRIGDDCAVLPGQGLVSSDMLVEGRHFRLDYTDFASLGWKSCAVNLSDIAAMAGRPRYLTVSLSLPAYVSEGDLKSFYQGFNQCARTYRAEVVGGDLTGGDKFVIAITVMGECHEKGLLLRRGARVGDTVMATGNFGASALGLKILEAFNDPVDQSLAAKIKGQLSPAEIDFILAAHLRPLPRLCEGYSLVRKIGSSGALMDSSDGLADSLYQISEASGVSMVIDSDKIDIAPAVIKGCEIFGVDPLTLALYGGEDYELVGCAAPGSIDFLEEHFAFRPIGNVVGPDQPGQPVVQIGNARDSRQSVVDLSKGYQHFW